MNDVALHLRRDLDARSGVATIRHEARARWGNQLIDLARPEPPGALTFDNTLRDAAYRATTRYSPPDGLPHLRAALAGLLTSTVGRAVPVDEVVITASATAGLLAALAAVAWDGGEVLLPRPCYPAFAGQVSLAGLDIVEIDTLPTGWRLTPEAVAEAQTPRTRALLLCNPNNPTTTVLDAVELKRICAVLRPEVAMIADEVYSPFVYGAPFVSVCSVLSAYDREHVSLHSASKTVGRPGWRIGAAVATPALAERMRVAVGLISGAPNVEAQVAYLSSLEKAATADHRRLLHRRYELALEALGPCGRWTPHDPQGTYYLWLQGPTNGGTAASVRRMVQELGVVTYPGEYFGDPNCVRISLSVSSADLRQGCERVNR